MVVAVNSNHHVHAMPTKASCGKVVVGSKSSSGNVKFAEKLSRRLGDAGNRQARELTTQRRRRSRRNPRRFSRCAVSFMPAMPASSTSPFTPPHRPILAIYEVKVLQFRLATVCSLIINCMLPYKKEVSAFSRHQETIDSSTHIQTG